MELKFFENRTEDQLVSEVHVTHAAVVVEMDGKVLYVKKRGKSTLELPSIDVSGNEFPAMAVRRLLTEQLNTKERSLRFVSAYSVTDGEETRYGALYYADITSMRTLNDPGLCGSYFLSLPPEDREKWSSPETDIPLLEKATGKK